MLGKFAFLIHPTEFDDLIACQPPAFDGFDEAQRENWRDWLASWSSRRFEPGVVYHLPAIRSKQGGYAEGWLIACTLTPPQMMRLSLKERRKLINEYIAIAKELEVDILGLGAFTSVITRAGTDIENCGIHITTGNSLTAMASAESLLFAAHNSVLNIGEQTAGVIGAAGSVGRLVCRRLAREVAALVLFGNPGNPKSTLKLEGLGGELYWQILIDLDEPGSRGIGAILLARESREFWTSLVEKYQGENSLDHRALFTEINELFAADNADAPITTTIDLRSKLPSIPLVVTATSQGVSFIDPDDLADHAIVCDAARPPDVRKEVQRERSNVTVYEGGLLYLPEKIRLGKDNVLGFPDGINLACLSETIALAFTRPTRNYSVGFDVPLDEAQYVFDTAVAHGFEIALLDSDGNQAMAVAEDATFSEAA